MSAVAHAGPSLAGAGLKTPSSGPTTSDTDASSDNKPSKNFSGLSYELREIIIKYVFTPDDLVSLKFAPIKEEGVKECRTIVHDLGVRANGGAQLLRVNRVFNNIGQTRLFDLTTFSVHDSVYVGDAKWAKLNDQTTLDLQRIKHLDFQAVLWSGKREDIWRCTPNLETFHVRYESTKSLVYTKLLDLLQERETFWQPGCFTRLEVTALRACVFSRWYRELLVASPTTIKPSVSVRVGLRTSQEEWVPAFKTSIFTPVVPSNPTDPCLHDDFMLQWQEDQHMQQDTDLYKKLASEEVARYDREVQRELDEWIERENRRGW